MAAHKVPLPERLEKWTRKDDFGCWIWLGQTGTGGYAYIKADGKKQKAASVVYRYYKGEVPSGLEISHTCKPFGNPLCVNPDHLVAETHSENLKRRRPFDRRTWGGLCKRGHVLPPMEKRNKNGSCPECYAEYQAAYRNHNRAKLNAYFRARSLKL
jgi:hypothetical protein